MAVLDLSRDDEIGEEQFLPELGCWFLFQCVDVQDVDGRWYESQIIELDDALNQVKIRFKGFHPKFDTNLSVDSDRIQLLHTYTHRPETHWDVDSPEELNSLIHVGTRLDAKDGTGAWFPASVIAKDSTHYMVKLHYQNWRSEFDEWINIDSYRLAPLHSMTIPLEREELGADAEQVALETKRNCMCLQNNPNRVKSSFKASISNEQRFREILKRKLDCEIVDMDNDGNCLFRSVSHQVYGDPAFHLVIRNKCMDYMESEADFFSRFTLGNDFGAYVSKLRRDGEWGDHVEIQAMSEIYDRPVEVYAYSETPIHIYRRGYSTNAPPIRLSYHFQSHYNSIIQAQVHRFHVLQSLPGEFEEAVISRSRLRRSRIRQDFTASQDLDPLAPALQISRQEFEKRDVEDYEQTVRLSLEEFEKFTLAQEARDLQSALEQSFDDEVKKALDSSQLEASISEQRALTESLPSAVSALVEAGYPADKCLEAYAAVSSLLGTSISLEDTLRYMTNFLLDGDIFGDSA